MTRRSKALGILGGLCLLLLLSPVWGFELLYLYGLRGVSLTLPSDAAGAGTLLRDALWVAQGETPGAGIEALWAGNYFRGVRADRVRYSPGAGANAANVVARSIVFELPQRRLPHLKRGIATAAVAVWLSRHASEAQMKQLLAEKLYFGRQAVGVVAAAEAFLCKSPEALSLGELALLASLPQFPIGNDPMRYPDRAEKRRLFILAKLRDSRVISSEQYEAGVNEPTLERALGCANGGTPP